MVPRSLLRQLVHTTRARPPVPRLAPLRPLSSTRPRLSVFAGLSVPQPVEDTGSRVEDEQQDVTAETSLPRAEHAVISAFDLFSIGVGPSSSHTVGPMRASAVFLSDLQDLGILQKVKTLKIGLYGSLAATGKGHMTPQAIMMGLEGSEPESIDPLSIEPRYDEILSSGRLSLNGTHEISYIHKRDMIWTMQPLPLHPNGMTFAVFDDQGDLLATNTYYSVGGGFVVNDRTSVDENLYYRSIKKSEVDHSRRDQSHGLPADQLVKIDPSIRTIEGPLPVNPETDSAGLESSGSGSSIVAERAQEASVEAAKEAEQATSNHVPPYLFRNAQGLLTMARQNNLTIAQLVWENERAFKSDDEITEGLLKLWQTMDQSIHAGVTSKEEFLPGRLRVRRRAPGLYKKLFKGFYPTISASPSSSLPPPPSPLALPGESSDPSSSSSPPSRLPRRSSSNPPLIVGSPDHPLSPPPPKRPTFPGLDFLSLYAIAVNETNAGGGRVVTAPTNGAAGVMPAVLKYLVEFITDDPQRDILTFLLTASAIGMLYKRGATISAAEGGCMAEVGVSTSMAAAAFTACMGGTHAQILQAAEIGMEHSLGLTCDPIGGLVSVPCIERNALGAVKAVTAAQLALAGDGIHSVTLDEAIEAMRLTARDMHSHYKETSLSGLATSVKIPLSSPAC
ncbi:hypothetical protein JCM10212_006658 [Sporobolomyces blumeae]